MYIASKNIWIFPCANRTENIESKLNTEANLTHTISRLGTSSYVFRESIDSSAKYVEFAIEGYYVKFIKDSISSYIGDTSKNLYANIGLIRKNLLNDSVALDEDDTNVTTVLGKYTTSGATLTSNLDIVNTGSTADFTGILFTDSNSAPSGTTYTKKTLQIISKGEFVNLSPVDTDHIKDGAITTDKIYDASVTTAKIANLNITEDKLAKNAVTNTKLGTDLIYTGSATNNGITVKLSQAGATDNKGFIIGIDSQCVTKAKEAIDVDLTATASVPTTKSSTTGDTISIQAGSGEKATFTVNNTDYSKESGKTTHCLQIDEIHKNNIVQKSTKYDGATDVVISNKVLGAATDDHTHGLINNDGTMTGNGSVVLVGTGTTKTIGCKDMTTVDPTPVQYTASTPGFISNITQDTQGKITPVKTKFSKGTITLKGTDSSAVLFTENSNDYETLTYAVDAHTNLEVTPSVKVTKKNNVCTLTFDGIMGHGLEIKQNAAACTKEGDCYINDDQSSANYRKLMVLTDSTSRTFTDAGYIQGKDGFGIKSIVKTATTANIDTYTITFYRPTSSGGEETYTTTYQITNGTSGMGWCATAAATANKVVDFPEFKFSGSNGKTPVTADKGRFITFYLANTNTVVPSSGSLTLKTQNTTALEARLNNTVTSSSNTWYLEKGLYRAVLTYDSNTYSYYWNLSRADASNLNSTIALLTPSTATCQTATLPGFIKTTDSRVLVYVTADKTYSGAQQLNINNTGNLTMYVDGVSASPTLSKGYYMAACTSSAWQLTKINLNHSVVSGKKADGTTNIVSNTSDTTITLGDSGVTAGSYGPTTNQTLSYAGQFIVPEYQVNSKGLVVAGANRTITLPSYASAAAYCTDNGDVANKTAIHLDYTKGPSYELITFKNANTRKGTLTLSINGKTAGNIYINGAVSSSSNYTIPAGTYLMFCDGSNYFINTDGRLRANGIDVPSGGIVAYGDSTFNNNLTVDGALTAGSLSTSGNAYVGSNLTTDSAVKFGGDATVYGSLYLRNAGGGLTTSNGIYFSDGRYTYIREATLKDEDVDDQLRFYARAGMNFVTAHNQGKFNFTCNNQTSTPAIKLDPCTGYGYASGWKTSSDRRLKTNIVDYVPEKSILDLPIKKFDFIDGAKNQIGCIAQDLQEICPEIVENNDGYLAINEPKLVYLLLDEVKKLRTEVDALKKANKKKSK